MSLSNRSVLPPRCIAEINALQETAWTAVRDYREMILQTNSVLYGQPVSRESFKALKAYGKLLISAVKVTCSVIDEIIECERLRFDAVDIEEQGEDD